MESITRKPLVEEAVTRCLQSFHKKGIPAFSECIREELLSKKIRFPLLEHAAELIYEQLPAFLHLPFCDRVAAYHTIGGNTITGKLLQLRSEKKLKESLDKAIEYIIEGDQWYVCDIIGERAIGHPLLMQTNRVMPYLKRFAKHPDKWIVRSVGVATHYAVKKGLPKKEAAQLFDLLLSLANTTDFHTKKGIGWAAKTIAKFHPDIIEANKKAIYENPEVKQWFRTKIRTGLGRTSKYAGKFS